MMVFPLNTANHLHLTILLTELAGQELADRFAFISSPSRSGCSLLERVKIVGMPYIQCLRDDGVLYTLITSFITIFQSSCSKNLSSWPGP